MSARRLSRPFCTDREVAERREWLVTNGRGSYAMGTVAGTLTRRYHGLLVAALEPPVGRRMFVPTVQIVVSCAGETYALGSNHWASGLRAPEGWRHMTSFDLIDGVPTWTYRLGAVELEVAIAMAYGRDETALALRIVAALAPVDVTLRVVVADRDHHGGALPDPVAFVTTCKGDRATIAAPLSQRTLHAWLPSASLRASGERWSGFFAQREAERGLDPLDDYVHAVDACVTLEEGATSGLVIGLDAPRVDAPAIVAAARERALAMTAALDPFAGDLALAADQFVVTTRAGAGRTTIVAGYPWFTDWGRDTAIALPGLTLALGRIDVAETIVRSYIPFVSGGMLPNVFPESGEVPEYNTVDAALWFVEAIRACSAVTRDPEFVHDLFPTVRSIVDAYTKGTRFGIGVDPADGLLRAGVAGAQVTWMDARVGEFVVTPRIGKPVEINALWYAALTSAASMAEQCDENPMPYEEAARRVAASFERFWNEAAAYPFDVLDGPHGDDAAIRPNALFAVALAPILFGDERNRSIVECCERDLVTPVGLRTLAPSDAAYVGRYGGDPRSRDGAYHQGTVWPWLIGPFVHAHLAVHGDRKRAGSFLTGLRDALDGYALGTLGEIFEGDAPHAPVGAVAQAWSVAEILRAYIALSD